MIDQEKLQADLQERYREKGPGNEPSGFRASKIGVPCPRYHYFTLTAHDQREPFSAAVHYEFERGIYREHKILELAKELLTFQGWTNWIYNEPGKAPDPRLEFKCTNPVISGHADGLAALNGQQIPLEAKTMATHTWERLVSAEDFKNAPEHYLQGYYGQLQAYLFLASLPYGYFILEAKERPAAGALPLKFIKADFDWEYMDAKLKELQRVEKAVASRKVPDPIPYTEKGCGWCPFLAICGNSPRNSAQTVDDIELMLLLDEEAVLKDAHARYEKVHGQVKKKVEGLEKTVIGNWFIDGEWRDRKGYEVKPSHYWQSKVERIED